MRISDLSEVLETQVPLHLSESYDNVGLLVGEVQGELDGILIALDITPAVLREAVELGANLVLTHHPIWFQARKNLIGNDFVSQQILYAIRNDLNLYACHTNLDHVSRGVNRGLVERLQLREVRFLEERPGYGVESELPAGAGMVGFLPEPLPAEQFMQRVKEAFKCRCIRYTPGPERIEKVALCGGSGSFLLEAALQTHADAFLTGDVTYHKFFDTRGEILYMDIGHFESEQYTMQVLRDILEVGGVDVPIHITRHSTNPVQYFL